LAETPVRELAAASFDGEQALANLHKLRGLVEMLAQGPEMTLRRTARELTSRILHPPDEAESPLAEEGDDEGEGAVRLLSIHKAKGLEYPMVILAGLHRGSDRRSAESFVLHDWASGLVGLRVGGRQTLGGLYVGAKLAWRQQAELRRVLYVGMTRAKRRLVLSAGLATSRSADSFLGLLSGALGELAAEDGEIGERAVDLDGVALPVYLCEGREAPMTTSGRESSWTDDPGDYAAERIRWAARDAACEAAKGTALVLSPTHLMMDRDPDSVSESRDAGRISEDEETRQSHNCARLVGIAIHRVLETWDFQGEPTQLEARVEDACRMVRQREPGLDWDLVAEETADLLGRFLQSSVYAELRRGTIVGREVPVLMPWQPTPSLPRAPGGLSDGCIMEGVIDLLLELDGRTWIVDYKTDRASGQDLEAYAERYRVQAEIYRQAVQAALKVDSVGFQFVFLRYGKTVEI
jgi:ATP-dependent helicase/nuclease subunit A